MNTYLFSYSHEGSDYAFEIRAESAEDARTLIARLQHATLDGELIAKIPALPGTTSLLAALLNAFVNLRSTTKKRQL